MSGFKNPPLPRHPALQPFSRDHYVGLVQARHLIKSADGTDVDRRAAVRKFVDAWHTDIAVHFADEERLLIDLIDESARKQLLAEHRRLRDLAAEADLRRRQVDPGADWVRQLGKELNDHIRWEERELFPEIQATAAAGLDGLETEAKQIETSRSRGRDVAQSH